MKSAIVPFWGVLSTTYGLIRIKPDQTAVREANKIKMSKSRGQAMTNERRKATANEPSFSSMAAMRPLKSERDRTVSHTNDISGVNNG